MMNLFEYILNKFNQILLPTEYCILCHHASSNQICDECYRCLHLTESHAERCWRCGIIKPPQQFVCNNCIESGFVFERLIAAFDYGFPLNNLLHELKYKHRLNYSRFISGVFYRRICAQITHLPHAIIPVPLHKNRQNERGFNQTHEIIREFTTKHPTVKIIQALRNKSTQQQAKLNRYARIANMHNAFSIPMRLDNLDVAIVDDVVTTGTTINELARLCKQLGASKVEIWCLLRAQN